MKIQMALLRAIRINIVLAIAACPEMPSGTDSDSSSTDSENLPNSGSRDTEQEERFVEKCMNVFDKTGGIAGEVCMQCKDYGDINGEENVELCSCKMETSSADCLVKCKDNECEDGFECLQMDTKENESICWPSN